MQDLKKEILRLTKENKELKDRLEKIQFWMLREVKGALKRIAKEKIRKFSKQDQQEFLTENIENIITSKIRNYFGDFILMNINSGVIENIVAGEIAYYQLRKNPNFDGFGVVSSYHKAIDSIVEQLITKGFRKFSKKKGQIYIRKNDSLEKAFHLVVNKNYILSLGRLYHILSNIKEGKELYDYGKVFLDYLEKYSYLKEVLLDKKFLFIFKKIIDSEILGKKRHSGVISFVETRKVRNLFIGDFKDKDSFIFMLLKTQDIYF